MINRQGIKSILSAYQSRGIGRRFAIYILMFSSVVTLTITIIQLLYDYRRDVGILNDQLQEIQIIYQDTLSTSVWVHNKTGLNLQLEGMMRLPTILYVQVDDESGAKIEHRGIYREQRTLKKSFELSHIHREKKVFLGKVNVLADLDVIYNRLLHKVVIIFISQLIKTFLVSLFILFLFHILVGRFLITMAEVTKKISAGSYRDKLDLGNDDELSDVSASFNEMTSKLVANMEALGKEVDERCRVQHALEEHKNRLEDIVREKTGDLIKANQNLQESKNAADAANKAKSMFLANMSHEIRTPINAMLGFSKMLKDKHFGTLNQKQIEHVDHIIESTNRLLFLIDDILDLSRVEAGKIEISNAVFSIDRLLKRIAKTYSIETTQKGLIFQVMAASNLLKHLVSDEYRIEQILRNLISNAVKFTEQGKIEVFVKMKSADEVIFEVRDTGIGIPQDKTEGLFDKFYQVDSSYTKKFAGAGLGLAISKELAELMGGEIWAESEVGKGSSFYYTLKAVIPDINSVDLYQKSTEFVKPVNPSKNLRILLAEDDLLNSRTMTYFLKKEGHEVTHSVNGNEVLANLKSDIFDIILMDIQMSEMDGIEATKRIRNSDTAKFNSKIPIIALTAYAMRGDREKFLNAGMDDYVTKPVDIDDLLDKISKLVVQDGSSVGDNQSEKPVFSSSLSSEITDSGEYITEIQQFVENTQDDIEFMKKVLMSFPNDAKDRLNLLEIAIKEQDTDKISGASHKFTALFSAILIRSAAKISQDLQKAARSDNLEKCNALFIELQKKMKHISDHIKSMEV